MIKKGKEILLQRCPIDSFSMDVNVYMRHHKSALFRTQFCQLCIIIYLHSDIVYRFNGESDNVVLELQIVLLIKK